MCMCSCIYVCVMSLGTSLCLVELSVAHYQLLGHSISLFTIHHGGTSLAVALGLGGYSEWLLAKMLLYGFSMDVVGVAGKAAPVF